jgi:NAD(P)-dependent dehydrogenase (short-subunit alcohol dehydrogenase family)
VREPYLDLVVVTGAGHGIGRAVAIELARRGAQVVCMSRTGACYETADVIRRDGGNATAVAVDIGDHHRARSTVEGQLAAASPGARIGLVLAAAILGPPGADLTELDAWETVLRVNLIGNLAVVRAALPLMRMTGLGRVVFLSGGGGASPFSAFPAYGASKAAIVRTCEHLHESLHGTGVTVVAIAPGSVRTRMLDLVEAEGGQINTYTMIDEAVACAIRCLGEDAERASGRLVHVRDDLSVLDEASSAHSLFRVRRVE